MWTSRPPLRRTVSPFEGVGARVLRASALSVGTPSP
jgi:hypothetical protein